MEGEREREETLERLIYRRRTNERTNERSLRLVSLSLSLVDNIGWLEKIFLSFPYSVALARKSNTDID